MATREASIQLVPRLHGTFAQPPAEIHHASLTLTWEIDEAVVRVARDYFVFEENDRIRAEVGDAQVECGPTGGVGSMVVQMAKAVGARVITTGGSDEK